MIGRIAALSTLGVLVSTGTAIAAPTPISPTPGEIVATSHPVFNWMAPFNEETDYLYVANNPAVTPDGAFYDENVVETGILFDDERQWSPTSPLYAGQYWWLVSSHDRDTFDRFNSSPQSFTVRPAVSLLPVKTHRYSFLHWMDVNVRWQANVRALTVKAQVIRRGKIVWKRTESETNSIGTTGSTSFTWLRGRRIKSRTRLTLRVTLVANGATSTRSLIVRAP
jgi:hypothetical protein